MIAVDRLPATVARAKQEILAVKTYRKDFFKADGAGAVLARRLAKAVDMSGAAHECIATLAIVPGDRSFQIVSLGGGSAALDPRRWAGLIDLSLSKAGESFASLDRSRERIGF